MNEKDIQQVFSNPLVAKNSIIHGRKIAMIYFSVFSCLPCGDPLCLRFRLMTNFYGT